MRYLGIDFGKARVGLAISDPLGLIASPLGVRPNEAGIFDSLAQVVRQNHIAAVVVGQPLHMDGSEGEAVAAVNAFVENLRRVLPGEMPLHWVDERLSTVEAEARLKQAGHDWKQRKRLVDGHAAQILLQDWLDARGGPVLLPDEFGEEDDYFPDEEEELER